MSHEDLTAFAARLAEMRDEATDPRDVLAYTRALDALRAWSGGQYGERPRLLRLWGAMWRFRSGVGRGSYSSSNKLGPPGR